MAISIAALTALHGCGFGGELNARLTGDAAGPQCRQVAVGMIRFRLSYPLLEGLSGWGRGVPTLRGLAAEIYVYDGMRKDVQRVVAIDGPSRWKGDEAHFSVRPRILPDGQLIFIVHGCPTDNPSCSEVRYYRVHDGRYSEMQSWPDVTIEESRLIRQCTSYLTYEGGKPLVNVGPTGGPWRPVLRFDGNDLMPLSDPPAR